MDTILLNTPAFILGIHEELEKNAKNKKRCWQGYEPVPGKKPYSEDSCRPVSSEKKAEGLMPASYTGVRANFEDLASFPIDPDDFMRGGGILSFGEAPRLNSQTTTQKPILPNKIKLPIKNPAPALHKKSVDLSSMPLNESILPTSSSQLKWKYSQTPTSLRLSDGNLVYSFGLPKDFPDEDTPVERLSDESLTDFEKDILSKGSAQIHRSSPDNIYLTLNDGRQNPTFMLQHERDKQWRYSPSKKFVEKLKKIKESLPTEIPENIQVDPQALLSATNLTDKTANYAQAIQSANQSGLHTFGHNQQQIAADLNNAAANTISFGNNAIDFMAAHPLESAFGGFLAAKGLSALYNKLYKNPYEEEREPISNPTAALLGIAPVVASKYIRNKY